VTDHLVAAYRAFAGNGASAAPAWLRELRERGITQFATSGLPSTRLEQWRFTNVQPIGEIPFALRSAPFEVGPAGVGAEVLTLHEGMQRFPEVVRAHLGAYASPEATPFAALAAAFLSDGLLVYVPAGRVVQGPIWLTCRTGPDGGRPMRFPRLLIVLERGTEAQIVESYEGAPGGESLTNAVAEVVLGDGAQLEYCRVQRQDGAGYHIATIQAHQGRDSRLLFTTVALGSGLTRNDINAVLDGTGASLVLNGLSIMGSRQHVDVHSTIDHAQPHCESHEYFNGVFDGEARGVFNGRIIVRPGAQRTDSKQTNNNLLLSTDARADSQPQLEIYADDVKCTHGSTVGPLDEMALFYLRSRGIGPDAARGLLTYGFGAEILDRVRIPAARAQLDDLIRHRLGVGRMPRSVG
jgi:Fe-S cluster assembly protein SufD